MINFNLSLHKKGIIQKWITNKDKFLLIEGIEGVGKSTLGKSILSDYYVIHINYDYHKDKNLLQYIEESLNTKNIWMMINNKNSNKAIIIDDIFYFIKYDKLLLLKILDILKKYLGNIPIILILSINNNYNIKHKIIDRIYSSSYKIKLKYDYNRYIDILKLHISNNDSIIKLHEFIKIYNFNLNSIISNIDNIYGKNTYIIDKEYDIYNLMNKVLKLKSINDIIRLSEGNSQTIGLNILENFSNIDIGLLCNLYNMNCIRDNCEFKYFGSIIYLTNYYTVYSCIIPSFYVRDYKLNEIIQYNKYTSRSIIQISMQKGIKQFNYTNNSYINFMILINKLLNNENIQYKIDYKMLIKNVKYYNYIHNTKIDKKEISNIYDNI